MKGECRQGLQKCFALLLVVQKWITICLSLLADNVCLYTDFYYNYLNPPQIFTLKLFKKFCTKVLVWQGYLDFLSCKCS